VIPIFTSHYSRMCSHVRYV